MTYNSLRKFWTSRIKEIATPDGEDPLEDGYVHERAVPYAEFVHEYGRFCSINRLKLEDRALRMLDLGLILSISHGCRISMPPDARRGPVDTHHNILLLVN